MRPTAVLASALSRLTLVLTWVCEGGGGEGGGLGGGEGGGGEGGGEGEGEGGGGEGGGGGESGGFGGGGGAEGCGAEQVVRFVGVQTP